MKLVQITPQLERRGIGGVASFAATLAQGLKRKGVATYFLVADAFWQASDGLAGEALGEHSAADLERHLAASGADTVLVHYANYGYQRRGCPAWLVDAVSRWRAASASRRLVTFFHEVYASGPPWRSSFWLEPFQQRLAARLLRASDGAATSLELYGRMLRSWAPDLKLVVKPVFSAVGEPQESEASAPEQGKQRTMLVFGLPGRRALAYRELKPVLVAACQALDIDMIVDLGLPFEGLPLSVDGVTVQPMGPQSEEHVRPILDDSYAGFLAYPAPFLAKSTVFAAYCAHGLVPVCAWPRRVRAFETKQLPFWDPRAGPAPADPSRLAAEARSWYSGHNLESQVAALHALLEGTPGAGA